MPKLVAILELSQPVDPVRSPTLFYYAFPAFAIQEERQLNLCVRTHSRSLVGIFAALISQVACTAIPVLAPGESPPNEEAVVFGEIRMLGRVSDRNQPSFLEIVDSRGKLFHELTAGDGSSWFFLHVPPGLFHITTLTGRTRPPGWFEGVWMRNHRIGAGFSAPNPGTAYYIGTLEIKVTQPEGIPRVDPIVYTDLAEATDRLQERYPLLKWPVVEGPIVLEQRR